MATPSKQPVRPYQTSARRTNPLRFVLPIWLVTLALGFWITKIDVRDATHLDILRNRTQASVTGEVAPPEIDPTGGTDITLEGQGNTGETKPLASAAPTDGVEPPGQKRVARYQDVSISDEDMRELACIVFLEASTEELRGQQAVVEVILNRVLADNFPNTIHDVIFEDYGTAKQQFDTAPYISLAEPSDTQYQAIEQALYGPTVLPEDVVFFSKDGENEHVWGTIGEHVFCYQYSWA